ncbi:alpha/beta fold hydrolase [Umezawaea sp. NPDC059074]|uniref:alpha/beta fold hydrolase n=1 Tax=Umezawaea sp. NPDC059074 TaxID=3346716 RepID=UPI0036855BD7
MTDHDERTKVDEDLITDDTPVVVGMACRFAGADGLDAYWRRLLSGRGALGPTDRRPGVEGMAGGFLDGHDEFDARFFRISPNEAKCMDPQQRLLLQSVQHAVDDAHLSEDDLRELQCGVFATGLPGDYRTLVAQRPDVASGAHSFLGNAPSTLSGRISYYYDIGGPSITLDSACSSSLSALHVALLNVRAGHCGAAIVGAVSVFSTSEVLDFARNSRMSSPTGVSAPFTDAADGFVPAEGVAAVVVMRHAEARARGLRVHGAVVATGLNHNGTTNGLAAPSGRAQARLMTGVHGRDGVDVTRIAYVETHGTGTELGDPLELEGLKSAFDGVGDCLLGAVKPVIGHTLVCSGLAGVIKVLLGFQHGTIPPAAPPECPVSYLDLAPFTVNHTPLPWPSDQPLAAVSAFGFTGSNGHVVLRRPSRSTPPPHTGHGLPFCLSAESEESLDVLERRVRDLAENLPEERWWDLAHLLLRRPRREHWRVVGDEARLDPEARALVDLWRERDTDALRRRLTTPAELADITLPDYPFRARRHWVLDDAPPVREEPAPVAERLCVELSALLGFGDGEDRVRPATPIASLGLDSLSAVQLLAPYQQVENPVRARDLFGFATVADLAAAVAATGAAPMTTAAVTAPAKTAEVTTAEPGPQLRWHERGAGPTTVLLPPMNADHRAWTQQIPALLAAGRRVLVPEYPGHGSTPFDGDRFSLERLADEVAETVGDAGADLVGWSLGGCVAALVALRHPGRVRSLALVNCAPRHDDDVFERTLDLRHELRVHGGLLQAVFDRGGDLSAAFTAGASMDVLGAYFAALSAFDVVDHLPAITAPCLLLRGGGDCVVDTATAALLTAVPGASVRELPGHGHYAPLTAGRAVNEALTGFWALSA